MRVDIEKSNWLSRKLNTSIRKKGKTLAFLCIVVVILSILAFWYIWFNNSQNLTQNTETETEFLNDTITFSHKTTVTAENYFPFQTNFFRAILLEQVFEHRNISTSEVQNYEEYLNERNITIQSYEEVNKYAEKQISPSTKSINISRFPDIVAIGMAETTATISWTQELNLSEYIGYQRNWNISSRGETHLSYVDKYYYDEISEYIGEYTPPSYLENLLSGIGSFFLASLPYLCFAVTGALFSIYAFRGQEFKKSYTYLTMEFDPRDNAKNYWLKRYANTTELSNHLKTIQHVHKQMNVFYRIIFGLSILLFKTSAGNWIKKHQEACSIHGKKELEEVLSEYKSESLVNLADIIPERESIVIILTALTALGISFEWNVGAIVPLLYSVAISYLFLNIGSTIYLVFVPLREKILAMAFLIVGIGAMLFPFFINFLRTSIDIRNPRLWDVIIATIIVGVVFYLIVRSHNRKYRKTNDRDLR